MRQEKPAFRFQSKIANKKSEISPFLTALLVLISLYSSAQDSGDAAAKNGEQARRAFLQCWRYGQGWLEHADPTSGLLPRNLSRDFYWNARDAAADNYPFLVLTTFFTDRFLFEGRMKIMLEAEQRLCNRVDRLPDDFVFATQSFRTPEAKLSDLIFGASEYVKDGLLPLTEWLGPSPWADRMIGLVDDVWKHADIETEAGPVPAQSHEVAGDLMQSLCRLYWMTGNDQYREYAFRLADYFLIYHSPIEVDSLQLDDHGCEVIGGLSEAYFLAAQKAPDKHRQWQSTMHKILDRILEVGRDQNGLLYSRVNPKTGEKLTDDMTDNWGYNYNAFLVVADLDNEPRYREAVEFVLKNLPKVTDYDWERGSADGYADSLEGGLNLMNRIYLPEAVEWADHVVEKMLAIQRDTGIVEGWHGDGNFARTALMYALWKTQGAYLEPWRADLRLGAARHEDGTFHFQVSADWPWSGKIRFDIPRHAEYLHLPADYPRLNQFPEWFTVPKEGAYESNQGELPAAQLREGIAVTVQPKEPVKVTLKRKS
ncbi:MAG: hypothetical protein HY706_04415 [Candidatus Hydrogenedentes bacterium]|nr:hypothetical protein [Candidatus Hydrogenedentota bacterium]